MLGSCRKNWRFASNNLHKLNLPKIGKYQSQTLTDCEVALTSASNIKLQPGWSQGPQVPEVPLVPEVKGWSTGGISPGIALKFLVLHVFHMFILFFRFQQWQLFPHSEEVIRGDNLREGKTQKAAYPQEIKRVVLEYIYIYLCVCVSSPSFYYI